MSDSTTPTTLIATPVLDAAREFLWALQAQWEWKRETTSSNQRDMDELDILIGKLDFYLEQR